MCISLTISGIIMLCGAAWSKADGSPHNDSRLNHNGPSVERVLREACEIALKQTEEHHFWTERVLLHIGGLQIQAGDFEPALRSIRGSTYAYGRNAGLVRLGEALARKGNRERAFEILRLLDSDHGWRQDYLEDGVQSRWIEQLIASGDLRGASKAVEQLKSERYRSEALRKLAAAYAKSRDLAIAFEYFSRAVKTATALKDESERGEALSETANSQLLIGNTEAAKATIRLLSETASFKDPWAKFSALRESAVLTARAKDDEAARHLFRRAMEAQKAVNEINKINALEQIAVSQAGVGYIDDALKTASMIKHSEEDFTQDGARERALYAVAVAQLKSNDADGAARTALMVKHYPQFGDDALCKILNHQITKRDLKAALASAGKFYNPSRKAAAILTVARAHAESGDRKTAAAIAARIELTEKSRLAGIVRKELFDYRLPRSWGVRYDDGDSFTMLSHDMSCERAAEVAAAAMRLALALGEKPKESYAVLFNEINTNEVTQALARAHAASGDPTAALAWARKIGSDSKADSNDDENAWAVQRRIHALIGVAEGILDRTSKREE
jgi:hypothetical protein